MIPAGLGILILIILAAGAYVLYQQIVAFYLTKKYLKRRYRGKDEDEEKQAYENTEE